MKIPTYQWHQSHNANFTEFYGCEIPSDYGDFQKEYEALRKSVGVRDVSYFGKVRMTGKDRQRFLNGMISNEVKTLDPGNGVWALFLDIKGHVQADMKVYCFADHFLMVCQHYVKDRLMKGLDRYIISEDVQMTDATKELAMIQIIGPDSDSFLNGVGISAVPEKPYSFTPVKIASLEAHLIRLPAGYALLTPVSSASALLDALNVQKVGMKAFEVFRVETGLALLDKDVEEMNFAQEAHWNGALNFNKGCYLGQEVMARIDAQGHVNKFMMGIATESLPSGGDKIYKDGKEIGKVTSVTHSLLLNQPLSLGYVRREAASEGQNVEVGEHRITGIVKKLPL
jgi:folate-binding protein YgfZ